MAATVNRRLAESTGSPATASGALVYITNVTVVCLLMKPEISTGPTVLSE